MFVDNQDTVVRYGVNGEEDKEVQRVYRPKDLMMTCSSSTIFNVKVSTYVLYQLSYLLQSY